MEGHERKKKLSSSVVSLYVVRFNPVLGYAKKSGEVQANMLHDFLGAHPARGILASTNSKHD